MKTDFDEECDKRAKQKRRESENKDKSRTDDDLADEYDKMMKRQTPE